MPTFAGMEPTLLDIREISFSYTSRPVIDRVSFQLEKGKNLCVIGESGCGKSTLLKLIYGLHDLDHGTIHWEGKQVLGPKYHLIPGMEYMKYLAQDFDLMPYITVAENVGKYLSNLYPEYKKARIAELLGIVELEDYADTKAQYLSGGQMQRVALARVLALEPEVLLLDEPFSHIDNFRKNSLRRKLFGYLRQQNITTIVATHDSTDVLSFANQVLVIRDGKILRSGTPEAIYLDPGDHYTASLFGDVNQIEWDGKIRFVYPHQVVVVEHSDFEAQVVQSYFWGSDYRIEAEHEGKPIFFDHSTTLTKGTTVSLKIKP